MRRILCIRLPDWPSQRHAVAAPVLDDREALELLAERCRRFSPLVGLEAIGNDSLLLDITGLAHLVGRRAAAGRGDCPRFRKIAAEGSASASPTRSAPPGP